MVYALSTEQTLLLRMRAQGLYPCDADKGVAQIVRDCGGIQAQDSRAAALSARARGAGLTTADVAEIPPLTGHQAAVPRRAGDRTGTTSPAAISSRTADSGMRTWRPT